MQTKTSSKIIVLSAPSGCGKDAIKHELLKKFPNLQYSVSTTTREKRPGEIHGKDYFFVSQIEFAQMLAYDEFLEFAEYCDCFYGTSKTAAKAILDSGKDLILILECDGAQKIKDIHPNAITIFIMPPSLDVLKKRLVERNTESPEALALRLTEVEKELSKADDFDYRVTNDSLQDAVDEISHIFMGVQA